MTVRNYALTSCWMSSLAYASRFKRLGKGYLVGVVAALACQGGTVVMTGPLPSVRRRPSLEAVPAGRTDASGRRKEGDRVG